MSNEVKEKHNIIFKNAKRLSRLINELMDFRKLQFNKMSINQASDIFDKLALVIDSCSGAMYVKLYKFFNSLTAKSLPEMLVSKFTELHSSITSSIMQANLNATEILELLKLYSLKNQPGHCLLC